MVNIGKRVSLQFTFVFLITRQLKMSIKPVATWDESTNQENKDPSINANIIKAKRNRKVKFPSQNHLRHKNWRNPKFYKRNSISFS